MAKAKWGWVYSPKKPQPNKVSEQLQKEISEKAVELVEFLKPKWIEENTEGYEHNHIVDIYSQWSRNRFYFCSKYACPGPNSVSPFFETKFARMTPTSNEKFNLAYFRYTGQWNEIFEDLTWEECFELIKEGNWFQP